MNNKGLLGGIEISIITVTLNNKTGLIATANSIIRQNIDKKYFEWIIIDGNSKDGSVEFIQQIQSDVAYWISEPDSSIYEAMNKGIMKANGKYLLFLNAGDCFCSEFAISDIINNKNYGTADFLSCNFYYTKQKKVVGIGKAPKQISGYHLFCNSLCHQSTLIAKERLISAGGYDLDYKITADAKFFFQELILNNASYEKLDTFIVFYDVTGISATNWKMTEQEKIKFLSELLPQRILFDYYRLKKGRTMLEKIMFKFDSSSIFYKIITFIVLLLYFPISIKNRLFIRLNKIK